MRNSCAKNAANKSAHITQIQQEFGRVCACGFSLYPGLTPYFFTIFFTPCSGWPLAIASIPSARLAGNAPQLDSTAARSGQSAPDMTIILNVGSL